jgi:predicted DNA-binding transcriptional regulator AlpA
MGVEKDQLQLSFRSTNGRPPRPKKQEPHSERPLPERIAGIDQVPNTHDIERITGRHRTTIYRWVLAGRFPPKRAGSGGGWLRSDVERWLSGGGTNQRPTSVASGRTSNTVP